MSAKGKEILEELRSVISSILLSLEQEGFEIS
jgi:hypothetical protein